MMNEFARFAFDVFLAFLLVGEACRGKAEDSWDDLKKKGLQVNFMNCALNLML